VVAAARAVTLLAWAALLDGAGSTPPAIADNLLAISDVLAIATLIVGAVTWLLWVAWTSRLEENASALGVGEGSIGPRGAILWWLVPGANVIVPFGQLLGLDRRLVEGERPAHDGLIAGWWAALLATAVAVVATTVVLMRPPAGANPQDARIQAALAAVAWMVVALMTLRVVREVQRDEDARAITVRAGWRPGAPSWSTGTGAQPVADRGARVRSAAAGPLFMVLLVVGFIVLIPAALRSASERPPPGPDPSLAVVVTPAPGATPGPSARPGRTPAFSPDSLPSPSPSEPVDPYAAGIELLLQHTTDGDGTCVAVAASTTPAGAVAAISCDPPNPAVLSASYVLYASPEAAFARYDAEALAAGVLIGSGDCFAGLAGERSFETNHTTRGRVLCFVASSTATPVPTFVWVDRTLSIVGRATGSGTDLALLSKWWADESGPA
jgi:hypothetical protein